MIFIDLAWSVWAIWQNSRIILFLVLCVTSQNLLKCTCLQRNRRIRNDYWVTGWTFRFIWDFFFPERRRHSSFGWYTLLLFLRFFKEAAEAFWRKWENVRRGLSVGLLVYIERKREDTTFTPINFTVANLTQHMCWSLWSFQSPLPIRGPHWVTSITPALPSQSLLSTLLPAESNQ